MLNRIRLPADPRLPIAAGLAAGGLAAAGLLVLLIVVGPAPRAVTVPPPSTAVSSGPAATPSATRSATAGPTASGSGAFHIGEPAPALRVPQVGGGEIALAGLRGQPVWVNFMATWCPPCRDEFPLMNRFYARYADQGLVVIAVDVREEEGLVAAFAESLNARFPIGLDADGSAQAEWQATVLPVHFWIDADGIVRDGALGGLGPDVMAAGLRAIMPGVDVQP